jgi:hypothetical protein
MTPVEPVAAWVVWMYAHAIPKRSQYPKNRNVSELMPDNSTPTMLTINANPSAS